MTGDSPRHAGRPANPSITDCLEAAMRADPSLTIEEAIRTVPISQHSLDEYRRLTFEEATRDLPERLKVWAAANTVTVAQLTGHLQRVAMECQAHSCSLSEVRAVRYGHDG